jgi:hypothetical protein
MFAALRPKKKQKDVSGWLFGLIVMAIAIATGLFPDAVIAMFFR